MRYLAIVLTIFLLFGCDRKQEAKSLNTNDAFKFQIKKGEDKISNITLNDGKVLVLNFFTTTCGGCKEELPGMVKLQNELKDKANIIGVLGEKIDKKQALKFLDGYKINFPIINQSKPVQVLSDSIGGVFGVPVTIVYDKNGKVIKKFLGVVPTSTLRKTIKSGV